jgi:hypothetical protein
MCKFANGTRVVVTFGTSVINEPGIIIDARNEIRGRYYKVLFDNAMKNTIMFFPESNVKNEEVICV